MRFRVALMAAFLAGVALADGPADNVVANVRLVPPKGAAVADADRAELKRGLDALGAAINELKSKALLPDVEIYHKAVRYALDYDEMYIDKNRDDVKVARSLLKTGLERAAQLKDDKPSWTTATGLVVRGYRSKIDGSAQPYGLVVPASYASNAGQSHRLDFWWHGRGELLTELDFIRQRQQSAGEFTPANAFVLHPYGRYCNANKLAGEVDSLECLEHVRKHYAIDANRIVARGFSMGGAACWQYAVHYPTLFVAAAPGAGFAETPEFLNVFQNEKVEPTWYEKKLWRMYNATESALNLYNLPTVAYSGEIDKQKQAADVMGRELAKYGIELTHVIGPKTGHSYHPDGKREVNRRIDALAARGKPEVPLALAYTTPTLRYNQCAWLTLEGLVNHWEPASINAQIIQPDTIKIETKNVSSFRIDFAPGTYPLTAVQPKIIVTSDSVTAMRDMKAPLVQSDRSFSASIAPESLPALRKRHGLQGPIDDAFLDRFIVVKPTGKPANAKVGAWVQAEQTHAIKRWRTAFRGDAIVRDDTAITDDDIKNANLILWGDPASNAVLAKIIDKLPLTWTATTLALNGQNFDATTHAPVMIFPNPLNPAKYVVLNSSFTFREYDDLNNARQVPKLPDYAILDLSTPPNARWPGKVVTAGFFDEAWKLQPNDGK